MAQVQPKPVRAPVRVRVPVLSVVRRPRADLDVGALRLQGEQLSAKLQNAITDSSLETTLDGATTLTLTVSDWHQGLLHSSVIQGAALLTFDGETFVLSKLARQGSTMTLTFEDQAVNLLRRYSKPKTADRASVTRAQFVRSLVVEVREARIPFRCPEINVRQPIASK